MRVSGERVGNAVGVERSGEPFRTRDPGAVSHPAMITPPTLTCVTRTLWETTMVCNIQFHINA